MAKPLRIAAVSRFNCSHHLDHLAPLCDLFQAKLLTSEDLQYELTQKFYPHIETELIDACLLNPEFLKEHYDVILHSFFWGNLMDFSLMPEKKTSRRKIRCVFTPHGNSDKGYYCGNLNGYSVNDISLLYGSHMTDMLNKLSISVKRPIHMGNLRYLYYQKYRSFFDELTEKEIFSRIDPKKKTILYAPTWNDYENNSSIFDAYSFVMEKLPLQYNLIVKLHPWMGTEASFVTGHNLIGKILHITAKYENAPGITFVSDFPAIYPLLAKIDIYLGDLSSIGYDFLAFNRPMFFFRPAGRLQEDASLFLHQCGVFIPIDQGDKILAIIEEGVERDSLYKKKREEMYKYAFGPEKDPTILKEEVIAECKKKK